MKKSTEKKVTFSIVLTATDYSALKSWAAAESRPLAQMARVIIEKDLARHAEKMEKAVHEQAFLRG